MAVRTVWNIAAFSTMRKSAPVEKVVRRHVEAIAAACGEGFEAKVTQGKTRVRGTVITATPVAMVRNARDNTLLNNLNAGS